MNSGHGTGYHLPFTSRGMLLVTVILLSGVSFSRQHGLPREAPRLPFILIPAERAGIPQKGDPLPDRDTVCHGRLSATRPRTTNTKHTTVMPTRNATIQPFPTRRRTCDRS